MRNPVPGVIVVAIAAIAALGCATFPGTARPAAIEDLRGEEGWVLLDTVPFVRQVSENGCGAACLAMVLGHWKTAVPAEALEEECFVAGEEGIRASALRDAAKRRGLSAFLIQGTVEDLEHELSRGRPVVVGVVKPNGGSFTTHYEVVVGLHPGRRRIATLDPAIGLLCDSLSGFEDEWRPTRGVTIVVFLPEMAPVLFAEDVQQGGGGS